VSEQGPGQGSAPLQEIEDTVALYRELRQEDPTRYAAEYAMALYRLGSILYDNADFEGSAQPLAECIDLFEKMTKLVPATYERRLSAALGKLVQTFFRMDRYGESLERIHRLIDVNKRLAGPLPSEYLSEVLGALNNLGVAYTRMNNYNEAERAFREALDFSIAKNVIDHRSEIEANLSAVRAGIDELRRNEEHVEATIHSTYTESAFLFSTDPVLGALQFTLRRGSEQIAVPVLLFELQGMLVTQLPDSGPRELQVYAIVQAGLAHIVDGVADALNIKGWTVSLRNKRIELRDPGGGLWAHAESEPPDAWFASATTLGVVLAVYGPRLGIHTPKWLDEADYTPDRRREELADTLRDGLLAAGFARWSSE
jgi:tetratricopeptide (TPR) repeat protein